MSSKFWILAKERGAYRYHAKSVNTSSYENIFSNCNCKHEPKERTIGESILLRTCLNRHLTDGPPVFIGYIEF